MFSLVFESLQVQELSQTVDALKHFQTSFPKEQKAVPGSFRSAVCTSEKQRSVKLRLNNNEIPLKPVPLKAALSECRADEWSQPVNREMSDVLPGISGLKTVQSCLALPCSQL